ncbi:MAG: serine hydroxymethyltransferase [Candidatus Nitrosocaldaceae archaeon]
MEFADVRPISGVSANLAVYAAFTKPNDTMLALAIPSGGHISHGKREHAGTAGLVRGLNIETYVFDKDEMNIDIDESIKKIEGLIREDRKPALAMFGGSLFLFPHPVKEMKDFLHENDIKICYDAAHVAGLIAGKEFQDPLREGADFMTMSTHKTLFGPPGGLILSFEKYSEDIKKAVFPGNTSSHHLHNVAGKAIALSEMLEFGKEYARQVIENAKTLAEALYNLGFDVLAEKKGFTSSHQVAVDVSKYGDGWSVEKRLEEVNIICNRQLLPGDIKAGRNYLHPGGIRLGTAEITRLGMKVDDMKSIAIFMKRAIIDKEEASIIRRDVKNFKELFKHVKYTFDNSTNAYEYIRLTNIKKG